MTTKTTATLIGCAVLAWAVSGEASSKSDAIVLLQEAMVVADCDVEMTGAFDAQTRDALESLQSESGLAVTVFPDADTLAALEIHPSAWVKIVKETGAPKVYVNKVRKAALSQILSNSAESMAAMISAGTSK